MRLLQTPWFVPLVAAVLSFLGGAVGSSVAGFYQQQLWEQQATYERSKIVLEQRVQLLERLSRVANSAAKMRAYNDYLRLQADLAQVYVACEKSREPNCIKPDDATVVTEISMKRADLNAAFSSTVQLISVYFGGEVKSAAAELAAKRDWWAPGREHLFRALLKAAANEIEPQ